MATVVDNGPPLKLKAESGDSLCLLAIEAGFEHCQRLRDANAGKDFVTSRHLEPGDIVVVPERDIKDESKSTDTTSTFVKLTSPPFSVRFVHGSGTKTYADDDTLLVLNVSNIRTDIDLPPGFGFDSKGDRDGDTFKVEVVDPAAGGTVNVRLEALRPVYAADGTIDHHILFASVGHEADRRITTLKCKKVRSAPAYRSKYLRLVVDHDDKKSVNEQTLLVGTLVDDGDEAVEILDQRVRATYEYSKCPATGATKCHATEELDVGESKQRAKMAVHILKNGKTGVPVSTIDQARRSCLKYVRELYAQANLSLTMVQQVREVPAPANMIAVANGWARRAVGGKKISIRLRVGAMFDETVETTTVAKEKPIATANALADAIRASFTAALPPLTTTVTVTENPPLIGQVYRTADIVIGDPLNEDVRLTIVKNNDAKHPVSVGRIVGAKVQEFDGTNAHVGTLQERVLVKNYNSGSDRIDIFIVDTLSAGSCGEAFPPNAADPPKEQPIDEMVNSALIFKQTIVKADNFHTTVPHEMGHILMDRGHAIPATEMMGAGSPVGSHERVVNGPKRISDPLPPKKIAFSDGKPAGNPVMFIRTGNAALLDGW
ncbi:MAG: hypothetical protein DMG62_07420 [Acidobacteria bacterium]|nr:MAG: hypothetical protein DMG62_07420 [Acidobacteriota bacterium]